MADKTLGFIAGTGFEDGVLEGARVLEGSRKTRLGEASADLVEFRLGGRRALFLQRHGASHAYPPHAVPYAANVTALREAGAQEIIAVGTVGGIAPELPPGAIAVPQDLIDMTWGRQWTLYSGKDTGVKHVDFTAPFDSGMRARLLEAAAMAGVPVVDGGVYWCSQGPRLETAAEVRMIRALGGTMVGMTACPECALAREAGLPYALLAVSVNWAAGIRDSGAGIDFDAVRAKLSGLPARILSILRSFCR